MLTDEDSIRKCIFNKFESHQVSLKFYWSQESGFTIYFDIFQWMSPCCLLMILFLSQVMITHDYVIIRDIQRQCRI